jgi:hypothetical protein
LPPARITNVAGTLALVDPPEAAPVVVGGAAVGADGIEEPVGVVPPDTDAEVEPEADVATVELARFELPHAAITSRATNDPKAHFALVRLTGRRIEASNHPSSACANVRPPWRSRY